MDAHLDMGTRNIRYEDIERAAKENGRSVAETFAIMDKTRERDRSQHPEEYAATDMAKARS
jgi:hypothetical protein